MESTLDFYRVKWNETLEDVSEKMYGRRDFHGVLFRHNSMVIPNPNQLTPGIVLAIPKLGAGSVVKGIIRELMDDD